MSILPKPLTKKQIFDLKFKWNLDTGLLDEGDVLLFFRVLAYTTELSEDFMREFKDNLDWKSVCMWQKLSSEEFIYELREYIDWRCLIEYQRDNISLDFYQKMKHEGYIKPWYH